MERIGSLKVKIYADGANLDGMKEMYRNPLIKGFTTNPTLMRAAGVTDYEVFARQVLEAIPDRPVSFEVFADDVDQMIAQARKINSWGRNVYVKIPVTNTSGTYCSTVIKTLSSEGVKLNVTAVFTQAQVAAIAADLAPKVPAVVSIFAGRIADSGIDPIPLMKKAADFLRGARPEAELLWASPRELLNIFHADACGCGIITVTNDVLKKLTLVGKNQDEYSLETVRMFFTDAQKAGYDIPA